MPRFEPFAGIRYRPGTNLDKVAAPPYDVISPAEREELAARSEHNIVRVDLPVDDEHEGGRYEGAASLLARWHAEGVLAADPEPCFYAYRMSYSDASGTRSTSGVIGALGLVPPGNTEVLPHEHTTPKAKSDRLALTRATSFNLSPIWGLSLAPGVAEATAPEGAPVAATTDEGGTTHELWLITDPERLARISDVIASAPVVIADGHHRWETSLAYQAECDGPGGHDLTMALVVELSEDNLAVRPIHRLLVDLAPGTDLAAALETHFESVGRAPVGPGVEAAMVDLGAIAVVLPGADEAELLAPRPDAFPGATPDLDSARLDVARAKLPDHDVEYQHGVDHVVARVDAGEASAGVLLRPATVAQIETMAHRHERMPPKTTYFFPKPRTGVVLRRL